MSDLVDRYKRNYRITEDITEEQVNRHLELELQLTAQLLRSTPADRRQVFVDAYSRLYRELPWLNVADDGRAVDARDWERLVGPPPASVYEVGSGRGALARALAARGYGVEATEITLERETAAEDGIQWSETDGIHLARFARGAPYDAVISNQVIEHLHPDDLLEHLRGAHAILKPGGRYVLETPLFYEGPADLSRVFGFDRAVGMHLREYTHRELHRAALEAGFARVQVPFGLPRALRRRFDLPLRPSAPYGRYLRAVEALVDRLPAARRKRVARMLKAPLFTRTLRVVAIKRPAA